MRLASVLLLALSLVAAAPGQARAAGDEVSVRDAWARATPGGSRIGAAYVTLESAAGDRLVGASSPVAARAELHEHTMTNGVMKMREVRGIELPAGQPVALKPGGYHIMLVDLKQKLTAGQSFPLTLDFEKAGAVATTVSVEPPGAAGPSAASGQ